MIIRLGKQERYGVLSGDNAKPVYATVVHRRIPRYIRRSVALHNECANQLGDVSWTREDKPVTIAKRAFFVALVIGLGFVFWPLFIETRELAVLALPFLVALATEWLCLLVTGESLTDLLASRIFGVPARPSLYIKDGIERKLVRQKL